jgi:hypothetical protein
LEYSNTGFVWVLDPTHADDDFFTLSNAIEFKDRDKDRVTPIVKRLYTIQFLKVGKHDLRFLRVKKDWIPEIMKFGTLS